MREEILKDNNPKQYFPVTEEYLSKISEIAVADSKACLQCPKDRDRARHDRWHRRQKYGLWSLPATRHGLHSGQEQERGVQTSRKNRGCNLLRRSPAQRERSVRKESPHQLQRQFPGGEPFYRNVDAIGWATGEAKADHYRFKGLYLHGDRVVLSYTVGGRDILESPSATVDGKAIWRRFQIGPGDEPLFCLVASDGLSRTGER